MTTRSWAMGDLEKATRRALQGRIVRAGPYTRRCFDVTAFASSRRAAMRQGREPLDRRSKLLPDRQAVLGFEGEGLTHPVLLELERPDHRRLPSPEEARQ